MNRTEVIMAIKMTGDRFAKVMASLCSGEYVAGYRRAISDMTELISQAPIDEDFETERIMMCTEIRRLRLENDMLKRDADKHQATINELLAHVDLHEVLGIGNNSSHGSRRQRGVRR